MTLVAVAAAQYLAEDVDPWGMPRLRALLPLAGMTLIEQQAERAREAGAARLLLLVDGVPAALAEACDRIRARGLPVELFRDGLGLMRLAADADRLLLVADGLVAGGQPWQAMARARAPALLVTDDTLVTQELERIDPQTRWAGLAVIEREALASLEQAPPDWDPQLLLLRRAVQQGAPRIGWDQALFVSGDIALATSGGGAAEMEQRLMSRRDERDSGIARRWLLGPLVRLFSGPLLGAQASGKAGRATALAAALAALGCVLAGQIPAAVGLGVLAALAQTVADFVARFRPEGRWWTWLGRAGLAVQLLGFAALERGSVAGFSLIGNGGLGVTMLLLLGQVMAERREGRPLLDLPAAWLAMGVLLPLIGRDHAATITGLGALGLLIWREIFVQGEAGRQAV